MKTKDDTDDVQFHAVPQQSGCSEEAKKTILVERSVYTIDELKCVFENDKNKPVWPKSCKSHFTLNNIWIIFLSFFPVLKWLPKYDIKRLLLKDISAGITLGVIQIPQGMAYGMLTTLPPIYGLYTSITPCIVYFIFGTSRYINIGTFAIVSLMIGETIENTITSILPAAPTNSSFIASYDQQVVDLRIKYAMTSTFLVGLIEIVFGMLHISFVSVFLSDPLIRGFTTGAAFQILASQVKHLVGIDIPRSETSGFFSMFKLYVYIFSNIKSVNVGALIVGLVSAVLLYVIKFYAQKYKKKIKVPVPAELIIVILGTSLSYGLKFHQKYQIKILKSVPTGMPPLSAPDFTLMKDIVSDCFVIAIVSYAINISIAKALAKKNNNTIDGNQELYAYGLANVASSFFSCFVSSGSLSRSLVQEEVGNSQLASLFSVVLVVLVLTVIAPLFEALPNAILAAIILITLKGLFKQFADLKPLFKVSKKDTIVWVVSFISVICLGVDYGLAVSLAINLVLIVYKTVRPSVLMLKNLRNTEIYMNGSFEELCEHPGIKIFQFCSPLIYANVEFFHEHLSKNTIDSCNAVEIDTYYEAVPVNGVPGLDTLQERVHTVVLDFSHISYVDTMGISTLTSICAEFYVQSVDIYIANFTGSVFQTLTAGGFVDNHGINNFFPSVHAAVNAALKKSTKNDLNEIKDVQNSSEGNQNGVA